MTPEEQPAAPQVLAGQATEGMLLAHLVEGENVGIEIRHIEPSDDGQDVLIVIAGAYAQRYRVDEPLDVIGEKDAEAAQGRLAAKRQLAKQVAALRELADLAEAGLPMPRYHLRIEGSLDSVDDLQKAAVILGCEVTERPNGTWRLERLFGSTDNRKYLAAVEMTLSHYARDER